LVPVGTGKDKEKTPESGPGNQQPTSTNVPSWVWVAMALVLVGGIFSAIQANKRLTTCPWEMDAVFALRELSNVEMAYRDFNVDHNFASLDALKTNGFVNDVPDSQIVPNYRIEIVPGESKSGDEFFIVRIFPATRARPCRTFQIGAERKIMEFVPRVSTDPHKSQNWIESKDIERILPPRKHLPWMGENYPYS
jgi:hypothetical protein